MYGCMVVCMNVCVYVRPQDTSCADFLDFRITGPSVEDTTAMNELLDQLKPLVLTIRQRGSQWRAGLQAQQATASAAADAAVDDECRRLYAIGYVTVVAQ